MRKIGTLKPGDKKVYVEGVVSDISSPREVRVGSRGRSRVANAKLSDDTGSIQISLWDEDIDKVREGDVIRVENGYVTRFRGKAQLNAGFYGRVVVVKRSGEG